MATITPTQNYVKGKRLRYSVSAVLNERPTITGSIAPSFTEGTGDTYDLSQFVTNPGGAPLTYTIEQGPLPTGVTIDKDTGLLTYDGVGAATTSAGLTFGVNDGISTIESDTFSVIINTTGPDYVPILADDMTGTAPLIGGSGARWYTTTPNSRETVLQTGTTFTGGQALSNRFFDGQNGFAGYSNLPSSVGIGETIWYRAFFYFPSTLSLSAGSGGDWSGWGKFLVLSPVNHGTPRMYVQLPSPQLLDFGDSGFYGTGLRIDSDGLGTQNFSYPALPRDEWFSLQIAFNIQTSGNGGWARIWVNDTFVGEEASSVSSGFSVQNWGIGDYWNGTAHVQGSSTPTFYMDEVIITSDEPNTLDAGGRPYISSATRVGDFA